jgi:hypothetical protein
VTTAVGDAEYVAGTAAKVVRPGQPEALAAAVVSQLDRGDCPEARERIVSNFSIERMVSATERCLMECAGQRNAGPAAVSEQVWKA